MLIGFDGSRAFSREKTGTENYSYQLLLNLAKIDQQNRYIVYLRPGCVVDKESWPANFRFKVINFPRLWTQVGLAFQTFRDRLELLFVPAHTIPVIRKSGLKTVVVVHDLGAEYLPKMHQLKQRLYLKFITDIQLKSATKLIAISQATRKDLIKKVGIAAEKIEVIYEGVDTNIFKPIKGDVLINNLSKFDILAGRYFLFVGTIQPRKNLIRLIEAFDEVDSSDLSLVLVGSKGWLSDEIYKLPKKLGIENKIKFLGRVEDNDLPSLYSGAIALILPSLYEGFGLPILEAQACGVPVITSNISSMPEVAGDGAILVDPENINQISASMDKLFTDDILRDKLIEKGSRNVKRFNWEKCARQTLEVFKQI